MKKTLSLLTVTATLSCTSSAFTVLSENFDGLTIGDFANGANGTLAGTQIRTRNNAGSQGPFDMSTGMFTGTGTQPALEVVAAPAAFTSASGANVVRISSDENGSGAISAFGPRIDFPTTANTATFTFSFDLYLPADATIALGDFQPRFRINDPAITAMSATGFVNQGNGPVETSGTVLTAGEHSISYTGLLSDFAQNIDLTDDMVNNPTFTPTESNETDFFIGVNQGAFTDDVAFIDNIEFTITPVPEPSSALLLGLGGLALLRRRR